MSPGTTAPTVGKRLDFGPTNYATYCVEVGGHTHDGHPLPLWEELGERIQRGWHRGGAACVEHEIIRRLDHIEQALGIVRNQEIKEEKAMEELDNDLTVLEAGETAVEGKLDVLEADEQRELTDLEAKPEAELTDDERARLAALTAKQDALAARVQADDDAINAVDPEPVVTDPSAPDVPVDETTAAE